MDEQNGIYPDMSELVPHEHRPAVTHCEGVTPKSESERIRLCQYAEDLSHAVPFLIDLEQNGVVTHDQIMSVIHSGKQAAMDALAACVEGYLTINPCTTAVLLEIAIQGLLDTKRPFPDLVSRVISLMVAARGPSAIPELAAHSLSALSELTGSDDIPSLPLPFPDRTTKEIIH